MFEEWDHARNLLHEVMNIYLQLQLFNVGFSLYRDGNSLTGLLEGDQISWQASELFHRMYRK